MESKNEIKRLTIYVWGEWFIIVGLLLSMYVIKSTANNIEKSINEIEKNIVLQRESCNAMTVRMDNIDQKLTDVKKLIEGEW